MTKVSVCIPCIQDHIPLLYRCIGSIYRQIFRPHEVIVSISSVNDIEKTKNEVDATLDKYRARLDIIILYTSEKQYAGINRNKAIEKSTGDIITLFDADDIMFSNRIYNIVRIFESDEDCYGVFHYFSENDDSRQEKWNFDPKSVVNYAFTEKIHFGHPSFKRFIFDEHKYSSESRIQDIKFVERILPQYMKNLRIYTKKLSRYISNDSMLYRYLNNSTEP